MISGFDKMLSATTWKIDDIKREKLAKFGRYCAECLPKFIQRVQVFVVFLLPEYVILLVFVYVIRSGF